jgi:hypothetical protein
MLSVHHQELHFPGEAAPPTSATYLKWHYLLSKDIAVSVTPGDVNVKQRRDKTRLAARALPWHRMIKGNLFPHFLFTDTRCEYNRIVSCLIEIVPHLHGSFVDFVQGESPDSQNGSV